MQIYISIYIIVFIKVPCWVRCQHCVGYNEKLHSLCLLYYYYYISAVVTSSYCCLTHELSKLWYRLSRERKTQNRQTHPFKKTLEIGQN